MGKNKRKVIFERDNNICLCCGTNKNLTLDHIIPKSIKGVGKKKNLQTLCKTCNTIKNNKIILYRKTNKALRYVQSFAKKNNISIYFYNKTGVIKV